MILALACNKMGKVKCIVPRYFSTCLAKLILVGFWLLGNLVQAEVRFDVFMGFGNKARTGDWFPVTVEIENNGPSFDGVIEIKPG